MIMIAPDAELRKRKKGQPKTLAGSSTRKQQELSENHATSLQTYTRLLSMSFILVGLGFVYFNRTLVSSFVDSWIGFSEQWEPSELVVDTPVVTNLPADTKKRAAVVAAFKVRMPLVDSRSAIDSDACHSTLGRPTVRSCLKTSAHRS